VVALVAGCNRRGDAAPAGGPPLPGVMVTQALARDVPVYLDEIGRTAPSELVNVIPQVSGKITERRFEDGADVTKGQVLFVIDPRPFQADLDAARAELGQNSAMQEFGTKELGRMANMLKADA